MSQIVVERYHASRADDWARVLADGRNGLFMFERNFLEYHGDRFVDFSSIAYIDNKPVAILPAAVDASSGVVESHPGLTFGGVVFTHKLHGPLALDATDAMLDAMRAWGGTSLTMKMLPESFCAYPSGELVYALTRRGFAICRCDLSSVIPLQNALPPSAIRRRGAKKAVAAGLVIGSASGSEFHQLLVEVLLARHQAQPVHSAAELELLMARFPRRIVAQVARDGDMIVAGALLFDFGRVWHTQYLASNARGRELGALDLVIFSVMRQAQAGGVELLSFGKSTEDEGRVLNTGLLMQKEGFGARSITLGFMQGAL